MRGDITSIGASADHAVSALTAFAHLSRAHVNPATAPSGALTFYTTRTKTPKIHSLHTKKVTCLERCSKKTSLWRI